MKKKGLIPAGTLFLLLFCLFPFAGFTQQFPFSREIKFALYLQDKELYQEAQSVLGRINLADLKPLQKDTVSYLAGWGAYSNKQLDTAISRFLDVSPEFPLYNKSRFFAAYCLAFKNSTDSSRSILGEMHLTDSLETEMKYFQLAGIDLLKRNYDSFAVHRNAFSYSNYILQKEEKNLDLYYDKLSRHKRKSPLLAGVYSAILPGAGKVYAGKKKQGIAAFLPVFSLGLVALEAYNKGGVKSARFITFGSLFSVFYIGNIWGSALSVKVKEKEFYREYDNKILFNLHIPLRNLYN